MINGGREGTERNTTNLERRGLSRNTDRAARSILHNQNQPCQNSQETPNAKATEIKSGRRQLAREREPAIRQRSSIR